MASTNSQSSIHELLQIFNYYRSHQPEQSTTPFEELSQFEPMDSHFNPDSLWAQDHFSFSQEKKKAPLGVHSSLEKVNTPKQPMTVRSKRTHHCSQVQDNTVFGRLYEENKIIKEKRERLFQEGRRSLEKQQTKQCTFSPNAKSKKTSKMKTDRSWREEQSQAFYEKNILWQNRKEKELKQKQVELNRTQKQQLTFQPKVNPYKKKGRQNKQNSQFSSVKKKTDSYLLNYHKANQSTFGETGSRPSSRWATSGLRQGYFSIVS